MEGSGSYPLRKFVAPEFIFGDGAHRLAGQYAGNLGATRVLLVSDPVVEKAGWTLAVRESLHKAGLATVDFTAITPNPKDHEVMAGADLFRAECCNVLVAIGGGSVMDCAKGIGIITANGGNILAYEGVDRVPAPCPPLICIPTTAGSSADVSQFAIISDTKRQVKIAIISKAVVPDIALIDPLCTTTMDATLTGNTAMDALCHAFEAYVSTAHSPITDLHALEAVRLIRANLQAVQANLHDPKGRGGLMLASLEAGLAFSNASLGATHAMAHSLGGRLNLPHGECNAVLLRHVTAFNFEAAADRYTDLAAALGIPIEGLPPTDLREALLQGLEEMARVARVDHGLAAMGCNRSILADLAEKAMQDPCLVTNPRRPFPADLEKIYEQAL